MRRAFGQGVECEAGDGAALLVELMSIGATSLTLRDCGRFGGAGVAGLIVQLPPPSPLASLLELRVSHCGVDDFACAPLANAPSSASNSASAGSSGSSRSEPLAAPGDAA